MKKSYFMAYSATLATLKEITDVLDVIGPSCDWHAPFTGALLFTSSMTAPEVAEEFENRLGNKGMYLITEITGGNKQGRLTGRAWRLANNPENLRGH